MLLTKFGRDRVLEICSLGCEVFVLCFCVEHYLSSSNYMDCISSVMGTNGCNLNTSLRGSDLPELFSKLGLGKYTDVFQQQEVMITSMCSLMMLMGPHSYTQHVSC